MRFTWEEIEPAVQQAFSVWVGGSEVAWAKRAWGHLGSVGLTSYSTDLERAEVIVRFLALADFYLDFCAITFEETLDPYVADWVSGLELSPFDLGRLTERHQLGEVADRDGAASEKVLKCLGERHRAEIVRALEECFDGKEGLLVSLWQTQHSNTDRLKKGQDPPRWPTRENVLNDDIGPGKFQAWDWLNSGCEPLGVRSRGGD